MRKGMGPLGQPGCLPGFPPSQACVLHRLLAPHGTMYLHLDWHADAYARLLLDEIFGREHFLMKSSDYHGPSPIRRAFNRKHDTYSPIPRMTVHVQRGCGSGTLSSKHVKICFIFQGWIWKNPIWCAARSPKIGGTSRWLPVCHKERTGYPTQNRKHCSKDPAGLIQSWRPGG